MTKSREERLAERLQFAAETLSIGVWEFDVQRDELFWDERVYTLHGLDPNGPPITHERWQATIHEDDREQAVRAAAAGIERGDQLEREYRVVTPQGVRRIFSKARVQRDASGAPTRFLGLNWDVTEQRAAEQQLERARRFEAIGRVAGEVAHDFNNVLMATQATADVLERTADDPRTVRELAASLRVVSRRARSLTTQLLSMGRHEPAVRAPTDVTAVLRDSTSMLRQLVGSDVTLEIDAPEASWVLATPDRIEQVIANLVSNAGRASGDGVVAVSVSVDHDDVRIDVRDDGPGFERDVLAQAFEPFVTTRDGSGGTGLGLAIVWRAVTQLDGSVVAENLAEGGARVTVRLPRMRAFAGRDAGGPSGTHHARVLVVDDDEVVRNSVAAMVRALGYEASTAASGEEALARTDAEPFELLMSDIRMPGISGIELVERLTERGTQLRFVLMTGFSNEPVSHRVVDGTVDALLEKPFPIEALRDVLRQSTAT